METKKSRRTILNLLAIGIGLFAGKTIANGFSALSHSRDKGSFPTVRIHPNAVSRNSKG